MASANKKPSHPAVFWAGLALMTVLTVVGLGGAAMSTDRILLQRALDARGQRVEGVVLARETVNTGEPVREQAWYRIRYRFSAGEVSITARARVPGGNDVQVAPGQPLQVRYLPDNPRRNLPAAAKMPGLYGSFALLGLVTGLAALIVLVSMILGRLRKRRAMMN